MNVDMSLLQGYVMIGFFNMYYMHVNLYAAELFISIFPSFEAGIAIAISSFK